MITFYTGMSAQAFVPLIMVDIFILLSCIAVGLYMSKKEGGFQVGIFADDFKTSLQSGIIYAITVAGFVYLYHNNIDTSIRDSLIEQRIEVLHEAVPDAETYAKLQEDDVTWKNKSYDDYIENQEDQIRSVISPLSIFIMHLMGLSLFAFFYSFFVTLIMRKVVLKGMN